MLYERFKKLERGNSKVICLKRTEEMPGGWNDEMDYFVGKPTVVYDLSKEFVILKHPGGTRYSFHYEYIEEYIQQKNLHLTWKGKNFVAVNSFDLNVLNFIALKEDVNVLCNVFNKINVEINTHVLNTIDKKCPRIIGVLLSNNFLIESTNGKE